VGRSSPSPPSFKRSDLLLLLPYLERGSSPVAWHKTDPSFKLYIHPSPNNSFQHYISSTGSHEARERQCSPPLLMTRRLPWLQVSWYRIEKSRLWLCCLFRLPACQQVFRAGTYYVKVASGNQVILPCMSRGVLSFFLTGILS
jgi:hypothetical protein